MSGPSLALDALELLGTRLASASLGIAVAGLVALGLSRLLPRRAAGLRAALWWLVAARALAELLGAPGWPVLPLPAQRAAESSIVTAPRDVAAEPAERRAALSAVAAGESTLVQVQERSAPGRLAAAAGVAWLLGVGGALLLFARSVAATRRILAEARPVDSAVALRALAKARARMRFGGEIPLLASDRIDTVALVGLRRPVILVPPSRVAGLAAAELELAFAHELAHVAHGDPWLGLLPAVVERLFFFHPMVRLAAREYALARESACDLEVLDRLGAPAERYGRLLVRLAGGARARAGGLAATLPLARPPLTRRIHMLAESIPSSPAVRCLAAVVLGIALVNAVPVRTATAEAPAVPAPPADVAPPSDPARPTDIEPPAAPTSPRAPAGSAPASPAAVPSPAALPAPVAVPSPAALPAGWRGSRESWVLLEGEKGLWSIDAGAGDFERAREKRDGSESLLYVRRNGAEWVIRSQEILDRFVEILEGIEPGWSDAVGAAAAASAPKENLDQIAVELERRAAQLAREAARLERSIEELAESSAMSSRRQAAAVEGAIRAEIAAKLEGTRARVRETTERAEALRVEALEKQVAALASRVDAVPRAEIEARLAQVARALEVERRELGERARALFEEARSRGLAEPLP